MRKIRLRMILIFIVIIALTALSACSADKGRNIDKEEITPALSVKDTSITSTPAPTPTPAATPTAVPVAGPVTSPAGFYVEGTKLYDVNGNEFIMRGINQAYTWYKGDNKTALKAIAATGANTVRIVLADGQKWPEDYMLYVKKLIEDCIKLKMIAVLEVHDATGSDSVEDLNKAVDYWIRIKQALIGYEQYVIINIANEWYGGSNSRDWADAYIAAIPKLREAGLSHTILIDSGGWGQYAKSVHDSGTEVFQADPIKNTMFAIHMYGTAGKNEDTIQNNIDGVRALDLCVTIGEFGYRHSDGDVEEAFLMSYCEEIGVGYLAWSWKGNGGGVEYLDIAKEWDGSVLSSDWGEILINGENGIRKTAKLCSVFE